MATSTLRPIDVFGETSRGSWTGPIRFLKRVSDRFRRYREYRRAADEMNACSDRTLRDLGIYRGDIRRLAREATYGRQ